MRVWTIILPEIRSRMPKDTCRTDAARDGESLEDLVYRPRISTGNEQVRSANPMIAVPLTLLGYLALGGLGWQIVRHSRKLLAEIPKIIAVDLQDPGDGEVATPPASLPAAGGPPPGAIERPDAPPPPIPANPDAVPEKPPAELPTQDLSGVAFPTQPATGSGGPGPGTGVGSGEGEGPSTGSGAGPGPRVVEFTFSQVEVLYQPKLDYPPMAFRAGIQGTVKVSIVVGLDGIPASAKAFEGPPILRSSAEAYALKWRFKPSTENGVPVLANFTLTVVFKLK